MGIEGMANLADFFKHTRNFFEEDILKNDSWFIDATLQDAAKKAWQELKHDFERLTSEVINAEIDNDHRLALVGLSGVQLAFKLKVFNYFWKEKIIKKILSAINSILGSLSFAFPLAEPIKEFKDFLKISGKDC